MPNAPSTPAEKAAQSFLRSIDATSRLVAELAATVKHISDVRPLEVKVPINYSIRFTTEVFHWLNEMSIQASDLKWSLETNDFEEDLQKLSNIQRAATSVLEATRQTFEQVANRKDLKRIDDEVHDFFLDAARTTNAKSASREERSKKKEMAQEAGQSFNIRFSEPLVSWLKEMADTQTRLTGQSVSIQQAANTILLLACRAARSQPGAK